MTGCGFATWLLPSARHDAKEHCLDFEGDKLRNLQKAWDFLELALGMYIQGDKRWIGCDSF